VSGSFQSEQDIANINFAAGGRMLRLSDIAQGAARLRDPPQPMFRVNGQPAIGLAIAMRDGGDILALGANIRKAMAQIYCRSPDRNRAVSGRGPAHCGRSGDPRVHGLAVQAIAIIMVVSFISLGVRPACHRARHTVLRWRSSFPSWASSSIDMQRISLGALIIALALLVDDAMTTTDATAQRLRRGKQDRGGNFRVSDPCHGDARGHAGDDRGIHTVGFAASSAGEYTFSLFAVVTIALLVSWFVAVIFTPLLGAASSSRPGKQARQNRAGFSACTAAS
jgi:multidrug efflux pump subunit AcrB